MATWVDVGRIGLTLPGARSGEAHSGEPAVFVGDRVFARSREDGRVLQFWVADEQLVAGYVESDGATFRNARGYSRLVVMARLSGLDPSEVRDVLVGSWRCRAPARLRNAHPDLG
jgi:hypothetical protein